MSQLLEESNNFFLSFDLNHFSYWIDMHLHSLFIRFIALTLLLFSSCGSETQAPNATVKVRLAGEPDGLNPLLIRSGYSSQLVKQLFQPLMEFDPESLELVPVLAIGPPQKEAITTGPYSGGVAYTYEIRPEAEWEAGIPILAKDYVFTIKSIFNPHLSNFFRSYLNFIKAVEVMPDNPRRFKVITDRPYFMAEVICGNIELLPEYFYDPEQVLGRYDWAQLTDASQMEALKQEAVLEKLAKHMQESHQAHEPNLLRGSGAYQLVEWQAGQRLRLEKKENWWGDQLDIAALQARATAIDYAIIPDVNAAVSLLKSGELDVLSGIPARQFSELQQDSYLASLYNWASPTQLSYIYIALNRKKTKLEDVKVRRALAYLLPVQDIVDQIMYGMAMPTIGPFSPESAYYNDQLTPIALRLDSARQLLQTAGWEDRNGNGIRDKLIDGQLVEMSLSFDLSAGNKTGELVALLYKEQAKKVGVDIQIQSLEFATLSDRLHRSDFEMSYSRRSYAPGENDPSQKWCTGRDYGGKSNYSGFGDAASDALIDSLRQSLDQGERYEKYRRLQKLIYEDQPVIFVAVPKSTIAIHRKYTTKTSSRWPGFFPERFQLAK